MIYRICKPQWVADTFRMAPPPSIKTRRLNEALEKGRLVMVRIRESKWIGDSLDELHIAPEGAEEGFAPRRPKGWPKKEEYA